MQKALNGPLGCHCQNVCGYTRTNQRDYDTRLHAKLFFSANKIPTTHDTSDAFFRRYVIISFPNNFEGKDEPDLLSKLTTEDELSGIFNVLMATLRRILKIEAYLSLKKR